MMSFLRLLTQPKVMGRFAASPADAVKQYLSLLALPEVEFAPEPLACEEAYLEYARAPGFVPRLLTDAYLAAFARSAGFRLVTFDSDFARFDGVEVLQLR